MYWEGVCQLVRALQWWNPLVHVAAKRMREEGECACDDQVLRQGMPPANYASHLLEIARGAHDSPLPKLAVTMACGLPMENRLQGLLDAKQSRKPLGLTMLLGFALVRGMLAIGLAAAGEEEPKQKKESDLALLGDLMEGIPDGISISSSKSFSGGKEGDVDALRYEREVSMVFQGFVVETDVLEMRLSEKQSSVEAANAKVTGPDGLIIECGSLHWDLTKDEATFGDGVTAKMKHRLLQSQDAKAYIRLQGIVSGPINPSIHGKIKITLTKPPKTKD
ncbi:MAG: M56 family metallopeptidase [Verrucomicrobiales bacterium]